MPIFSGKAAPIPDKINNDAASINPFFLPSDRLTKPATDPPMIHPIKAAETVNPVMALTLFIVTTGELPNCTINTMAARINIIVLIMNPFFQLNNLISIPLTARPTINTATEIVIL